MKTFRNLFTTIVALLFACVVIYAQEANREELTIPLSKPGQPGKLECGLVNGSITITGYSGNEVQIIATMPMKKIKVEQEVDDPDKIGMKKITANSFSLSAEEHENHIDISSASWRSAINLEIKVPMKFDLEISTVNYGNIVVENVEGTLEVTNVNGSVTLTNVSGSVVSNTVNGDLKVTMNRIDADTPMSFTNFNGKVDVTLPSSTKATVKIKTTSGDIYTDFDVSFEQKRTKMDESDEEGVYKVSIDEFVSGKLNGGGPEFVFKTYHGNIYLRKK